MKWCDLNADEGPYYQTQRFDRYKEVIRGMLDDGTAYHCYCTKQELDSMLRSLRDRYGTAPAQLDNLAYSLRVKLRGQRMGLRGVIAEGHDIVIRVDPHRLLDVEELSRRMAGQISVGPNRIKMRRKGEGWQADLMILLDEMTEVAQGVKVAAKDDPDGGVTHSTLFLLVDRHGDVVRIYHNEDEADTKGLAADAEELASKPADRQ